MQFPTLPHVTATVGAVTTYCDSCYYEVPATREVYYVALPGTADEHGSTLAICDRQECEDKARDYIENVPGDVIEIVTLDQPVPAHAA